MEESGKISAGRESKPHIGIYGRCNSGKSSLLNFITGADHAVVSPQAGTTTDPVRKNYEILDFAPVVFIDTPGVDDRSELGRQRIKKTFETLMQIDLALIVYREWGKPETELVEALEMEDTPFILVHNRTKDEAPAPARNGNAAFSNPLLMELDAVNGSDRERDELLGKIKKMLPEQSYIIPSMFEGRAETGDVVILVCPIDSEAPAGRLILPQVQAIRNLLDKRAIALVIQPQQIRQVFGMGVCPKLVVTDSQIFSEVREAVPEGTEITSFSILLARLKGDYDTYSEGLDGIDKLHEGDRVLILENCTHQVSCDDIGRVKIPRLLQQHSGCELHFTVLSGLASLPDNLSSYALAVQCGGCMVTRSQLQNRIRAIRKAGVPVTNYGMLLNNLAR